MTTIGYDTLPEARAIPDPYHPNRTIWKADVQFEASGFQYMMTVEAVVGNDRVPGPLYVLEVRDQFHHARLVDAEGVVYADRAHALPAVPQNDQRPPSTPALDEARARARAVLLDVDSWTGAWGSDAADVVDELVDALADAGLLTHGGGDRG